MIANVGGSGFTGSRITEQLIDRGEDVVCIDVNPDTDLEQHPNVEVEQVDITDFQSLNRTIEKYSPDGIINLAYLLGAESESDPAAATRVNCVGMENVFQAAAENGVDRVAFASSLAIYGTPGTFQETVSEDSPAPATYAQFPVMYYAATKQLNEYQAKLYDEKHETDYVSVRPSTIFGPGREAGYTAWSSAFVSSPANGDAATIPHEPEKRLNMIYREDVANLFVTLITADSVSYDAYNSGGHEITAGELASIVEREIGGTVRCDPDEPGEYPHVSDVSNERARTEFDYDLTSLDEAIRDHARRVRE